MSLLFALITVLATAEIGRRWFGPIGILGGAILVSLPTWETLVMRAGNDAFACMLAAIAVLISVCAPKRADRHCRRGDRLGAGAEREDVHVAAADHPADSVVASARVENARDRGDDRCGDRRPAHVRRALVANAQSARRRRVRPAGRRGVRGEGQHQRDRSRDDRQSSAWTSGQHNDALRPIAIALYLGPILIARARRADVRRQPASRQLAFAALCAFALAQAYNVIACVLARHGGNDIPIGGKEGWYWYVLAPVDHPRAARARAETLARRRVVDRDLGRHHHRGRAVSRLRRDDVAGACHRCSFDGVRCTRRSPRTLDGIGVGPLAAWTTAIRIVHLAAFFGLESFLQHMRLNDRNTDIADAR